MIIYDIKKMFLSFYGGSEEDMRVFEAPGRVNLIGEHIDYCGGCVMPAALTMKTTIVARKRQDNIIRLRATDLDVLVETTVENMSSLKGKLKWGDYQLGVAIELKEAGYLISGCDVLYDDTVPHGGGLSSSAAIEVSTALMFATFSNEIKGENKKIDMIEMAKLSQKAEHNFIGVKCGIMDQFASAMGKEGHAVYLNCDTLSYEHIPLKLDGCKLVLTNTHVKHSLGSSKYNERRLECEEGLEALRRAMPFKNNLAEVSTDEFEQHKDLIENPVTRKRIKHIVYECERVRQSAKALKEGRLNDFGKYMNLSHKSLKDDYEVTCPELDYIAETGRDMDGVVGIRMTGAGFGGCTVAVVREDAVYKFQDIIEKGFLEKFGHKPSFYVTETGDGAKEVV